MFDGARLLEEVANRDVLLMAPDHPLSAAGISGRCSDLRSFLLEAENPEDIVQLSKASYWEITPKYRFDLLATDLGIVANQLAVTLGMAGGLLSDLAPATPPYFPTLSDRVYWCNIDFGVRLASSAWDRLALFLDLAFDLRLQGKVSFPKVMKELPKLSEGMIQNGHFRALKAFRDREFRDLEGGMGRGARHEATHLIVPSTRYFAEFIERVTRGTTGRTPEQWVEFLVQHHGLYLDGLEHAVQLVEGNWRLRFESRAEDPGVMTRLLNKVKAWIGRCFV